METTMETLHYVVPATSYPRYDYSKRHISSIYKRFGVLMKDLNLDSSGFVMPEYGDVDIFVARRSITNDYVDETFLELKSSEKTKLENKGQLKFRDVEDLMERNDITDISTKIVVACVGSESEVGHFMKYPHNVVIVTEDESLVGENIEHEIGTSDESRTQITEKATLGNTICLLLERIVFRNLRDLVTILSGLSVVAKNAGFGKLVTDEIRETIKSVLGNKDCFRGWLEELNEMNVSIVHPELTSYKQTDTTSHSKPKKLRSSDSVDSTNLLSSQDITQTSDQSSQPAESEGREKRQVPEYLKYITNIEERYIKGSEMIYYLVYKLAAQFGFNAEQVIFKKYRNLPQTFRDVLRVKTDERTVQNTITEDICELLVTCFDKDMHVEEGDAADDLLRIKLRSRTSHILHGTTKIIEQLEFIKLVDEHLTRIKDENDRSITRLVGDIMGMYNRSKVPQFERPTNGSEGKRLNEKIAKDLFKTVKAAKECGYRYGKLYVYLEEAKDQDEKEKTEKEVRDVLVRYNISDYIVKNTAQTLQHFMEVGDRITVTQSGTLGGFALMGQQKTLCALLSEHVVNGASDVLLGDTKIGCMISAHGAVNADLGYVDVAAARILEGHLKPFDTKFKDSQGRSLSSVLCKFEDIQWLSGLPVHICGASTKFVIGTITVPEHFVPGMNGSLISIEDTEEDNGVIKRFCKEGDSGAVVCADDPDGKYVHVIAMLIGSRNSEEFRNNPKIKGQYLSFRMTSGLKKLEYEHGQPFTLSS